MRVEVLERAELGVDRRRGRPPPSRSPTGCPDRPWPASSVLFRPLRFVVPDRVDRRQVDDVEAELGELAAAPASTPREAAPRAREELVPGAEARALAVDVDLERRRASSSSERSVARVGERLLDRQRLDAVERRALGRARSRGPPGPRRPCAGAPGATRRSGRPTPRRRTASGRSASSSKRAVPAVVALVAHRRLPPAPLAGAAGSARRRRAPRARRGRRRPRPRPGRPRVRFDRRSGRRRPAARRRWIWIRRGGSFVRGSGHATLLRLQSTATAKPR